MAHLWVLLALQATFLVPASTPIVLADIWWTLRSGAWMAEHQALLTLDPFTSAPPAFPQLNAQWLAQLLFHGLFRLGGLELVITANALAATAAFGLVVAAAYTLTGRLRLACAAGLLAYGLGFTNLGPRPQTLAYPLFGLYLFALARARAAGDRRWLWLLPPAMAVWANLHGSFPLGLVLLASVTAGTTLETRSLRAARPFGLSLLAAFVAACLTPYGPGSLAYVLGIGTNTIIRDYVTEWAPSSLGSPEGVLFFASAVLAAALALRSPARLTASEWLLLAAFGWVGASSIRGVIWWGLVLGPVVARLAAPLLPRVRPTGRERPLLNLAIAALILASMVLALPWLKGGNPLLPADKRSLVAGDTPVAVAEFLRGQRFPGRMLSYQGWGGYFGWALWPQHQPFLDGRIELHPPEVWLDYLAIAEPDPDWQVRLDRYAIGYLVLSVEHNGPLIQAVGGSPASWQVVYADRQAVVFVRK